MSSITITIIQTNLHWGDKKANLEMLKIIEVACFQLLH